MVRIGSIFGTKNAFIVQLHSQWYKYTTTFILSLRIRGKAFVLEHVHVESDRLRLMDGRTAAKENVNNHISIRSTEQLRHLP